MVTELDLLADAYENCCNEYVNIFCKKQDVEYIDWIGNEIGGVVVISDYFINFSDIKLDVDQQRPKGEIFNWYNDNIDAHDNYINYKSYTMGLRTKDI